MIKGIIARWRFCSTSILTLRRLRLASRRVGRGGLTPLLHRRRCDCPTSLKLFQHASSIRGACMCRARGAKHGEFAMEWLEGRGVSRQQQVRSGQPALGSAEPLHCTATWCRGSAQHNPYLAMKALPRRRPGRLYLPVQHCLRARAEGNCESNIAPQEYGWVKNTKQQNSSHTKL